MASVWKIILHHVIFMAILPSGTGDQHLGEDLNRTEGSLGDLSVQLQVDQNMTDAEAAQMSHLLGGMKMMALGIQDETKAQIDNLDNLGESIDKATARLQNNTKQVKKMT